MSAHVRRLKVGQSARITNYRKEASHLRQKLLALGLVPGAILTLVRRAPFGDPIELSVRGMSLVLRNHECEGLELEVV